MHGFAWCSNHAWDDQLVCKKQPVLWSGSGLSILHTKDWLIASLPVMVSLFEMCQKLVQSCPRVLHEQQDKLACDIARRLTMQVFVKTCLDICLDGMFVLAPEPGQLSFGGV